MAPEPERPIEKLLRRAARNRRERAGDNWNIHPATRGLWQREAARLWGRKSPGKDTWLSWISGLRWLKTAGALAVIVIVIGLGFLLTGRPKTNRTELVRNELSPPAEENDRRVLEAKKEKSSGASKQLLTASNPTADQDLPVLTQGQALVANGTPLTLARDLAGSTGPAPLTKAQPAVPSPGATPSSGQAAYAQRYGLARGLTPPPQNDTAGVQLADAENSALAQREKAGITLNENAVATQNQPGANANQKLVQYGAFQASQTFEPALAESEQLKRSTASPALALSTQDAAAQNHILTSFQLEQSGQNLRVIDNDGSVYGGAIEQTNAAAVLGRQALADRSDALVASQNKDTQTGKAGANAVLNPAAAFRVAGTNRTSKQLVVFSGLIRAETNLDQTLGVAQVQRASAASGFAAQNQASNSVTLRVSGTAVIDGTQQIHIEAAPMQH